MFQIRETLGLLCRILRSRIRIRPVYLSSVQSGCFKVYSSSGRNVLDNLHMEVLEKRRFACSVYFGVHHLLYLSVTEILCTSLSP